MSITFAVGIMFLFVKIAFNVTDGYLIHYASFMASRAYLVIDINSNEPGGSDAKASETSAKVFKNFVKSKNGEYKVTDPLDANSMPFVGVSYKFKRKFSFGFLGGKGNLNLTSESFLGKEPTRSTCSFRICDSMDKIGGSCEMGFHMTLYDNGC